MKPEARIRFTPDPSRPPGVVPSPHPADADLAAGLQRGDAAAYEDLLRRYQVKVYNLARSMMHNDQDAQDVLQDTFLSVFKNVRSFRGDSSLSTWLYRITVNSALMRLRRNKTRERTVPIEEFMPVFDGTGHRVAAIPDWHPRADELLEKKQLGNYLRQCIAKLEPDYRTVILLRDQQGLTNEEVAAVLGLSVAAVKSRLHRARVYLREQVKRYVLEGG